MVHSSSPMITRVGPETEIVARGRGGLRVFRAPLCLGVFVVNGFLLAACSPGRVHVTQENDVVGLPRPAVIYVFPFAVDPSEVRLDPGGPVTRIMERLGGGESDQDA